MRAVDKLLPMLEVCEVVKRAEALNHVLGDLDGPPLAVGGGEAKPTSDGVHKDLVARLGANNEIGDDFKLANNLKVF